VKSVRLRFFDTVVRHTQSRGTMLALLIVAALSSQSQCTIVQKGPQIYVEAIVTSGAPVWPKADEGPAVTLVATDAAVPFPKPVTKPPRCPSGWFASAFPPTLRPTATRLDPLECQRGLSAIL
jgi:hypothetical protein